MKPKQSWILLDSNKLLREHSKDISVPVSKEDKEYIDKMMSYIDACDKGLEKEYGIRPGIAVAAPQVGFLKKVIYINFEFAGTQYRYLLANPKIVSRSLGITYLQSGEGCLSVADDHEGYVPRNSKIIVKAYDLLNNKDVTINAEGLLSICLQHEIDHLSGILYYDHINKQDKFYTEKNWKPL